ncbi:hypothetical protein GCM10011583_04600 [Streptomyces camponoticapitis]|uniref:DUF488 domain-containing protein n=1 Tax=Streptomyces camponoticapitis TaxID=1616125 RepID=A0ABQ2DZM5_9ACTN|nr:DUF488 domain-containing protein [Streptomyces camponoticapitis]GGJ76320.1 hypothetical protein GCM10011583_04600 [Streptomyces camponoticapitis]
MTPHTVFTVGHSTHSSSGFLSLLQKHGITAIADVRSMPVSRFTPQFNRYAVERTLSSVDIKYVFLGKELGARPEDLTCYVDGQVRYELLARTSNFVSGINRLRNGSQSERIAVMCTEQEPLDCHRCVLVARALEADGIAVQHIHGDGHVENHSSAMRRLMTNFGLDQEDLFRTSAERLQEALDRQEQRIAYVNEQLRVDGTPER